MADALILVRHGPSAPEPERPASAWGLTDAGRQACRHFAPRIRDYQPSRLLSSVEPKALQTAAILANALGLPYAPFPGLHEHVRETVGWMSDPADFRAAVGRLLMFPETRDFGEESGRETLERFRLAVSAACAAYPDDRIAIVTHGTALTLFLAATNPLDPVAFWQRLTMPAAAVITWPAARLITTLLA